MRDTYTVTFHDDAEGMAMMERYRAFLRLQSEAGQLGDEEYLDRLDEILGDNMTAMNGYPDGDPGVPYSSEIERILALQEEDEEAVRGYGQRRVLQFDEPAQDNAFDGSWPQSGAHGQFPADSPDGGDTAKTSEAGDPETDPSLDIPYEAGQEEAADAGMPEADPSLDVAYEVGSDEADDPEHASDLPLTDASGGNDASTYVGTEDPQQAAFEEPEPISTDAAPEEWTYPEPAPAAHAPSGGHIEVTEEFEIHDWLDTLAAGTGLLFGVQTAEYVPEDEPAGPDAPAPAYEKTDAMKQMDLMVAQKFPEPEYEGPELTGP